MNDMIERYVYDVVRRLPMGQREDIGKELNSLLQDALEARCDGGEPTQDDIADTLREFGSPVDVAERYLPGRKQLIGPRYYDLYMLILKIALGASALGLFISTIVSAVVEPMYADQAVKWFGQFFADIFNALFITVGTVTILFGLLEHFMPNGPEGKIREAFDPRRLPAVPTQRGRIKPADEIAAIIFTMIAVVLINYYPMLFAYYIKDAQGNLQAYALLSQDALRAFLPLWNISWGLSLLLHVVILIQGRRRIGTHLARIALEVYNICIVIFMMRGPALLSEGIVTGTDGVFHSIISAVNARFTWVYTIIIIFNVIEIIKSGIQAARK